jgi:predicted O-methyltransferase YrrM
VGRLFYQLAQMVGAETVFEMGSAVGYSTIWWARAVGDTGKVIYTDGDRKNADEAKGYFQRAGVADRIDVRTGDALELLSEEKGQFDIIFCDIDKDDYPRALKLAAPRVRRGGLFVADNTLWHGRVIAAEGSEDAEMPTTKAIKELNQALYASKDFFATLLPLRDGVAVGLKL